MKAFKTWFEESDTMPKLLYHATYGQLIEGIKKHGLGGKTARKSYSDSRPGTVYLAVSPEIAESYAEVAEEDLVPDEWKENIAIFELKTKDLDKSKLTADKNVLREPGQKVDTYEYSGVVPFTKLKKL